MEKKIFKMAGHGSHLRFPIGRILAIFDLKVTPMLPIKFQVIGLSVQEAKRKNIFTRWRPWQPSWISNQNDFSYF